MKRMGSISLVTWTMIIGVLALLFGFGALRFWNTSVAMPAQQESSPPIIVQTTPTPASTSAAMPVQQDSSPTLGDIQTTPTRAGNDGRGLDDDDDFYGFIDSRPEGTAGEWLISGRSFTATTGTSLDPDDGPLTVGACVSVDYADSTALDIESEPADDCGSSALPAPALVPGDTSNERGPNDDDFYGFIDSRPEGTAGEWVISGRSFAATTGTTLDADDGPLTVGACVSVDYAGSTALDIESEPADDCAD